MAATLFRGKKGQQLAKDIGKRTKTFVPGVPVVERPAAVAQSAPATAVQAAEASTTAKQNIEAIKVNYRSSKR